MDVNIVSHVNVTSLLNAAATVAAPKKEAVGVRPHHVASHTADGFVRHTATLDQQAFARQQAFLKNVNNTRHAGQTRFGGFFGKSESTAFAGPNDAEIKTAGFRNRDEYQASLDAGRRMARQQRGTSEPMSGDIPTRMQRAIRLEAQAQKAHAAAHERVAARPQPTAASLTRAGFRNADEYKASLASARRMLGNERATQETDASTHGDRGELPGKQKAALRVYEQSSMTAPQYQQKKVRNQAQHANSGVAEGNQPKYSWSEYGRDVARFGRGEASGFAQVVSGTVKGTVNTILHPVTTGENLASAAGSGYEKVRQNGVRATFDEAASRVQTHVGRSMNDLETGGRLFGQSLGTAATIAVPGSTQGRALIAAAQTRVAGMASTLATSLPSLAPVITATQNVIALPATAMQKLGSTAMGAKVGSAARNLWELGNTPLSQVPRKLNQQRVLQRALTYPVTADQPNFNIGKMTASEAQDLGQAWVGPNARPMVNRASGETIGWRSDDGQRQFRMMPKFHGRHGVLKGQLQANLEQFDQGGHKVVRNAHIDIEK